MISKFLLQISVAVFLALISAGCATTYKVQVNSFAIEAESGSKYVLVSQDPTITPGDLQFQEYSRHVHRALEYAGYELAADETKSDVAVYLEYGISGPQTELSTKTVPITSYHSGGTSSRSSSTTSYIPVTEASTVFARFIKLTCIDLKTLRTTKRVRQLWQTTVRSTGTSGDFRQVFPVMMGAALDYLGENTGNERTVALNESDVRVVFVRRGR